MQVTVEADGVLRVLRGVGERATDLRPAFAGPIDKYVTLIFARRFASSGGFSDVRWAPLRPLTLKLRQRAGHGRGGILHDTGRLWASLVKAAGPEAVRVVTPDRYERGTAVPYARFQQRGWVSRTVFGRPRRNPPSRRIPARRPLPERLAPELVSTIERILLMYTAEGKVTP